MGRCVRTGAQRRKRAFYTRRQGIIKKVQAMNSLTDAKTAVLSIYEGQTFCHDDAGVLEELGVAVTSIHQLRALSAESVSSTGSEWSLQRETTNSSEFSKREGSSATTSTTSACSPCLDNRPLDSAELGPFAPATTSTRDRGVSPPRKKRGTQNPALIASLDLDFFGVEKDGRCDAASRDESV